MLDMFGRDGRGHHGYVRVGIWVEEIEKDVVDGMKC